ncbi:MAG: aminopeptidase, partial [Sphingomonadaceae bacterium]
MIGKIASFELKYQLKNPVFWVGVFIFFLLGFGLTASENVQIGTPGVTKENGAYPIMVLQAITTVFYLFILTAFVANAIVRDDSSGFAPMVRATPVTKGQMVFGRFIGSFAVAVLGFLAIPLGLFLGTLMPWVDPELVGPHNFKFYAWPFLIFVIPNLFFASALLFSVSTATRSLMWSYVVVILLVMFYLGFQNIFAGDPEQEALFAQFDPFGVGALTLETRYWTGAEFNSRLIDLEGILLSNRILVLLGGVIFLAIAYWRYSNSERAPSKRKLRKIEKRSIKDAKLAAVPPTLGGEAISAKSGEISRWAQFAARLGVEMQQMLRSPGLPILILVAIIFTAIDLFDSGAYGNDSYPTVASTIATVRDNFSIFILIIAAFYGGELVWRERDRKMNEIVGAAPVPGWIMTVPKILAIFLILLVVNLSAMVTGLLYQSVSGAPELGIGAYLSWFIFPAAIEAMLITTIAIFLQILSPNKYVGWGLILAWFLLNILLANLGFTSPLYTYAGSPNVPLSDLVDPAPFLWGNLIFKVYWGLFAIILLVIAHLLWPRGAELTLPQRVFRLKRSGLPRVPTAIAAVCALAMAGLGSYLYYNINVLNTYRNSDAQEARIAEYERRFLQYEELAQPAITDVTFDVDLYPEERRMMVDGRYLLRNDTDEVIETLHVRQTSEDAEYLSLDVAGATLAVV